MSSADPSASSGHCGKQAIEHAKAGFTAQGITRKNSKWDSANRVPLNGVNCEDGSSDRRSGSNKTKHPGPRNRTTGSIGLLGHIHPPIDAFEPHRHSSAIEPISDSIFTWTQTPLVFRQ